MKRKKIIFSVATHGNEGFTIPILKKLSNLDCSQKFDWIISNPKALKKYQRYIEADLNRVAPGNINSNKYELRRAYDLIKKFNQYQCVIDLHGTPAKTGIFTIVTNPKKENLLLASLLPIQNVVIWSPDNLQKPGPLTQFVDCGVEIECGSKDSIKIQKELGAILVSYLNNIGSKNKKTKYKQRFFRVYESLLKKDYEDKEEKLKEFEKIKINGEIFFPLLVNRYPDITCYKMQKININL